MKGVGASTIYNHLCDLSLAFSWFSLGRKVSNHDSTHISQSDLFVVYQIMKNLKRSYKVATKKVRGGTKTMTHLQTHLQHTSTTSAAIVQRIFNFISRASKLLQVRSYLETPYSWIVNLYKYLDKLLQQHVHVIKLAQKHHAILPHHFTSLSLCSLLYLISLS